MRSVRVLVIGGGASGMMAAIMALAMSITAFATEASPVPDKP